MAKTNEILALRSEGLSYRQISMRLHTPIGTVKSACSRGKAKKTGDRCRQCGNPLTHCPGKKRKEFCCDSCRWRWHRENDGKGK